MKKLNRSAFTLVELLVVITILAIISVVAYQNFGGAVDKANSGKKISDVSIIEASLVQYKDENSYYPAVALSGATNMWGYSGTSVAYPSNTIKVTKNGEEITGITSANGGGKIYGSGTLGQIGAKGTINQEILGKKFLTKDLYDLEIGDIKVGNGKMIDYGLGRYVYSVYKKPKTLNSDWGTDNKNGTNYNIAYTIKEEGTDGYITKIVGDYDENSCYENKLDCPKTLIGTLSGATLTLDNIVLENNNKENSTSDKINYGVPYAVNDFSE